MLATRLCPFRALANFFAPLLVLVTMQVSRLARLATPVFAWTAFVLLLITFLTPNMMLKDRSSLFTVSGRAGSSRLARSLGALQSESPSRFTSSERMVRVAKKRATPQAASSASTSSSFDINIGMTGAQLAF